MCIETVKCVENVVSVSDILSMISIALSVIVAFAVCFCEIRHSKKISRINLNNKYYEKIFDEILLYEIPKGREYFVYIGGELIGTEELQKVLVTLRKKSIFFKYQDRKFYDKLCDHLMNIEDYLLLKEGKLSREEYLKFESEIDEKIKSLYTMIDNNSNK